MVGMIARRPATSVSAWIVPVNIVLRTLSWTKVSPHRQLPFLEVPGHAGAAPGPAGGAIETQARGGGQVLPVRSRARRRSHIEQLVDPSRRSRRQAGTPAEQPVDFQPDPVAERHEAGHRLHRDRHTGLLHPHQGEPDPSECDVHTEGPAADLHLQPGDRHPGRHSPEPHRADLPPVHPRLGPDQAAQGLHHHLGSRFPSRDPLRLQEGGDRADQGVPAHGEGSEGGEDQYG